jgi:hypothetical protein
MTRPPPGAGTAAGFARQITVPPFVLDLRRAVRASGARRGPLPPGGPSATLPSGVLPSVVLLSRAGDGDLDGVAALLRRAGVPATRLDADRLAAADLLVDPAHGRARLNGQWLAPTVTWLRHFTPAAVEVQGGPVSEAFSRESWAAAAAGLTVISSVSIGVQRPGLLTQLRHAVRGQITVPRTVVTTDPRHAARLLDTPRLIVKAAGEHFVEAEPGRLSGIFPTVVSRDELASRAASGPPVVVQEYVEHDAELRVYYADGALECFEVGKLTPADPWLAPGRVSAKARTLPPAVAAAARFLAAALSLRYAAFDFLLRGDTPVFLEANPDGDWRWLEARTGAAPVTAAVAGMLCRLHRACVAAGPDQRPASPFDLLGFLSG